MNNDLRFLTVKRRNMESRRSNTEPPKDSLNTNYGFDVEFWFLISVAFPTSISDDSRPTSKRFTREAGVGGEINAFLVLIRRIQLWIETVY